MTRGDTSAILAAAAVACESPAWYMSWRSLKDDYLYDIHTHTLGRGMGFSNGDDYLMMSYHESTEDLLRL